MYKHNELGESEGGGVRKGEGGGVREKMEELEGKMEWMSGVDGEGSCRCGTEPAHAAEYMVDRRKGGKQKIRGYEERRCRKQGIAIQRNQPLQKDS